MVALGCQGGMLGYVNPLFSHPSERSLNSSFTRSSEVGDGTCFSPNCPGKQRTRLQSPVTPGEQHGSPPHRHDRAPRAPMPPNPLTSWPPHKATAQPSPPHHPHVLPTVATAANPALPQTFRSSHSGMFQNIEKDHWYPSTAGTQFKNPSSSKNREALQHEHRLTLNHLVAEHPLAGAAWHPHGS